jgi:hypothetical protein
LLPVERTDTPHRELPASVYPWFIGRVLPLSGLSSIVGMSGGPIFGLKKMPNGEWRYWVVALQSWWDAETKTVYGCPVPIFASLIADWLDRVLKGNGPSDSPPSPDSESPSASSSLGP